jgi:hypothetical protein
LDPAGNEVPASKVHAVREAEDRIRQAWQPLAERISVECVTRD